MSQRTEDHGPEYRHADEMPWETLRFPGQQSKMVFHPRPERPTGAPVHSIDPGARISAPCAGR